VEVENMKSIDIGAILLGVFVFFALGNAGYGEDIIYQALIQSGSVDGHLAEAMSNVITGTTAVLATCFLVWGWFDLSVDRIVSTVQLQSVIRSLTTKSKRD
jgi:hypothetical protein